MDRPFAVSVGSNAYPRTMNANIEFVRVPDNKACIGIDDVVKAFARLAEFGGLSGEMSDPGHARPPVATRSLTASTLNLKFEELTVGPASLFVLVNMLHWLHAKIIPLRSVSIQWPAHERVVDPLTVEFPGQWPHLSYDIEVGDLLDDIDVEIELALPQPERVTDKIVDCMAAWLLVTHRGGFANDAYEPPESAVFLGPDVMQVEADYIAWFIEIMRTDEDALDSLLNVLEWVHQNIAAIRSVSLSP